MFSKLCKKAVSGLRQFSQTSWTNYNKSPTSGATFALIGLNFGIYFLYQKGIRIPSFLKAFKHDNVLELSINSICLYFMSKSIELNIGKKALGMVVLTSLISSYTISALLSKQRSYDGNMNMLKTMIYYFAFKFPNDKAIILPIPVPLPIKYVCAGLAMYDTYKYDYIGLSNIINGWLSSRIINKS